MFGTFAIAELPLAASPESTGVVVRGTGVALACTQSEAAVALDVTAVGVACSHVEASAVGHAEIIWTSAPASAVSLTSAQARPRLDIAVGRSGRATGDVRAHAVGRLEIGSVIARVKTKPLPDGHVETAVLPLVASNHSYPLEDIVTSTVVVTRVTMASTGVLADCHASTTLLEP